jgi:DNA-binding MarR family transcriptional regulator
MRLSHQTAADRAESGNAPDSGSSAVVLASPRFARDEGIPRSQAAIGRHIGLDPNTTSQILRGLAARGLVSRERTADDRAKETTLSAQAEVLLANAIDAVEAADAAVFAPLATTKPLLAALRTLATPAAALKKAVGIDGGASKNGDV